MKSLSSICCGSRLVRTRTIFVTMQLDKMLAWTPADFPISIQQCRIVCLTRHRRLSPRSFVKLSVAQKINRHNRHESGRILEPFHDDVPRHFYSRSVHACQGTPARFLRSQINQPAYFAPTVASMLLLSMPFARTAPISIVRDFNRSGTSRLRSMDRKPSFTSAPLTSTWSAS